MDIPKDVYLQAYRAGDFGMADFKLIAEWARKQTLEEAAGWAEDRCLTTFASELHSASKATDI